MARRIEFWPIDRLVPYAKNARTHSAEQVAQIAASIAEFGFNAPILVDSAAGGIAIEAFKVAGHSDLEMTGEHTFVAPERQTELMRRIQKKLAKAGMEVACAAAETPPFGPTAPELQSSIGALWPASDAVQ